DLRSCHGSNTSPYAAHKSDTSCHELESDSGTNSTDGDCEPLTQTSHDAAQQSHPPATLPDQTQPTLQSPPQPTETATTTPPSPDPTHTNQSPPTTAPGDAATAPNGHPTTTTQTTTSLHLQCEIRPG